MKKNFFSMKKLPFSMNNSFIAYGIPISIYSYMLYDYYSKRYKTDKEEKVTNLGKKDNSYEFLKDVHYYCDSSKDDCLLSHTITVSAYNDIKLRGIDQYLDNIKRNPKIFETDKEYVFIWETNKIPEEQERGNLFAVYHVSPDIHQEYAANSESKVQETCGKGKCELVKIMKQIAEVSDQYKNGGFVEYEWYDVKTQETIIKKSFVIKLEDVEYKGKKTNLYIGSGHTVKQIQQEVYFFKLNILIINCFVFITMWIFFDFNSILKNRTFSFLILILSSFYLSSLMFDSYKINYTQDEYDKQYNKIMSSSKILAALLGSIILYLNLITEKQQPAMYKLLVMSILFTLLSSIYYSSKDLRSLSIIYIIKNISIINASLAILITFIVITLNKLT